MTACPETRPATNHTHTCAGCGRDGTHFCNQCRRWWWNK